MRIVAISDTHTYHKAVTIPDGDVFIHAGDFTSIGRVHEVTAFNTWLGKLPHKYKIVCAGNHDALFETQSSLARSLLTNAIYLQDDLVELEGIKFYGSPYTPTFCNWYFMRNRGEDIKKVWDKIPTNLDVLITHGPPYGIQDWTLQGKHVGCEELRVAVDRIKPKYHVFGHIHLCHGIYDFSGTTFINASICTESYEPINSPIVFEIEI